MNIGGRNLVKRTLVALCFGGAALLVMAADLYLFVPGTQIVTDPRELFVTLGAALTGPLGAVIIGLMAGAHHPIPHFSPVVIAAHVGGALWMNSSYRWLLHKNLGSLKLLLGWGGLVMVYYFGVLVPLLTALTFLTPRLDGVIFSAGATLWQSLWDVASGAVPEALLTTVVTAVMLALLPQRFKKTSNSAN